MRNPYVVGGICRGTSFYGRAALIDSILHGPQDTLWLMGNRRVGKTSLLLKLEELTSGHAYYIGLFWDLQGVVNLDDLSEALVYALEDAEERLAPLSLETTSLESKDVFGILRELNHRARKVNRKLLLLCDEAEALINVGENNPRTLQKLRKVLLGSAHIRTVLTAAKGLGELHDLSARWGTSPFLNGFLPPHHLSGLNYAEARDLVTQTQSSKPIVASEAMIEEVMKLTNNHPFLIQLLCQRLYTEDGSLREPTETDLVTDDVLARLFLIDFRHLSDGERSVLLQISRQEMVSEEKLCSLTGLSSSQTRSLLYSLTCLGYVKRQDGQFAIANWFFTDWLRAERDKQLMRETKSKVSDKAMLEITPNARPSTLQISADSEIVKQIKGGNCVLFVGAGVSISAHGQEGLPSGSELARELAKSSGFCEAIRCTDLDKSGCKNEQGCSQALQRAAQHYEGRYRRQGLISFLRKKINAVRQPLYTHQAMATLTKTGKGNVIITTNYDQLIEKALEEGGVPYHTIVTDVGFAYQERDEVQVIKVHGDISREETIIITERDYWRFFSHLPALAGELSGYLRRSPILFIGYGLGDENFRRIYAEVARQLGEHRRLHYAVQWKPTPYDVRFWEDAGVRIVDADATTFLTAVVEQLSAESD